MKNQKQEVEQLILSLHRFRRVFCDDLTAQLPIKRSEFMLLHILHRKEKKGKQAVTISQLAKISHAAKSTISPVIQSLVEDELVTRQTDTADRRISVVALTPAGRALVQTMTMQVDNDFRELLTEFGDQKIMQLLALLDEFSDLVEQKAMHKKKGK